MIDPNGMAATESLQLSEVGITAKRLPEVNIFSLDVLDRSIGFPGNYDARQSLALTGQNVVSVNTDGGKKNQNKGDDKKKPSLEDMKKILHPKV